MCLADKWVSGPPTVICDTQEQVYKMVTALTELPPEKSVLVISESGCQMSSNTPVSPDMIIVSVIPFSDDTFMMEMVGVDGHTYYASTRKLPSTALVVR